MTATSESPAGSTQTWIDTARRLGASFASEVAERDRSGELSKATFDTLREEGITAALVPTEFGGGGATHADMGAILRELARHDPSTAVTLAMHSHLLAAQVWRHKHGIDAEKIFRRVVDDRALLVSTGASDWIPSNGTTTRVDGGYRVSARKSPASGCEVGDIVMTSVRWEQEGEAPQVIHCSIPFSAEGVSVELTWDTLGLRATGSHTVVYRDVFVPDAAVSLVRPADEWHPVFNVVVGAAMPLIMAAYNGIADHAVELALGMAAGRTEPHTLQTAGEMMNAYVTGSDLVAAMFADTDDLNFANTDDMAARWLSRKTVATDAFIDTVRRAIELTGGVGYTRSSDLERLYRDVHGALFHPLLPAKQQRLSGRVALGHSPWG
jgi:alkylation response protein AidB-like acyl-CoA dehydrogenase